MSGSLRQDRCCDDSTQAGQRRFHGLVGVLALVVALAGCGGTDEAGIAKGLDRHLAATSWTLNTWVRTGGGSLTSLNATGQLSTAGSVFKTQTAAGTIPFSVTANAGYSISQVSVNGVVVATSGSSYTGSFEAPTAPSTVSVWVYFAANRYTLTASAGPGSSVTPTSFTTLLMGGQATVNYQPITGWHVEAVTVTGATAATCNGGSCAGPFAANARVTVISTVGTSNITVSATSGGNPTANAGASQVVPPGRLVTLDGRATVATTPAVSSWTWTQVAPASPVVTLATAGPLATFTAPTTEGTYSFKLTVLPGASSSTTNVVVTTDPVSVGMTQCGSCHAAAGVGTTSNVFGKWSASTHAARYVMCYACHIGTNTGGHPAWVSAGTVDKQTFTWLIPGASGFALGSNFCAQCHATADQAVIDFKASVHSSAVGGPGTCSGCHGDAHEAASGPAKCVGCHASSGTVVGHPFPVDSSAVCTGCHNPHTTAAAPSGNHDIHIAAGYGCSTCHVAVIGVVGFDPAGAAVSPTLPPPTFDPATKTCSNVACHAIPSGRFDFTFPGGDGEPEAVFANYGGGATTPSWYAAPTGGCTACHNLTSAGVKYVWHSGTHGGVMSGGNSCQTCHPDATGKVLPSGVSADTALSTASTCGPTGRSPCASLHRNGLVDVKPVFRSACFGCH